MTSTDTVTEPHRCHQGARCARWEADADGVRHGAPINAERGLCETCTARLEQALNGLVRDYLDLERELAVSARGRLGDRVRGTPDALVPLRLDVATLQAEITHEVHCWAESTADVLGIVLDTQRYAMMRPGAVVQRCTRLLATSVPVLLSLSAVEHPGWAYGDPVILTRDGLDGAATLLRLHHSARSLVGHTRLVNELPAPCPRCEAVSLRHPDGSDTVTCNHCNRRYTLDEYQRLCTVFADWHERYGLEGVAA